MKWYSKIQLQIMDFFKRHKKVIITVGIVWIIIIIINYILSNTQKEIKPITTYTPDEPVMDQGDKVPKNLKDPIKHAVDEYFNYCNTGNYEDAFNMLTDDCKEYLYNNDIERFKLYLSKIFDKNKIYNLQNFSNKDNVYIYSINILDDILTTGTNGNEEFKYYEEKMAAIKDGDTIKLTNNNYIKKENLNLISEENYLRLTINDRQVSYDQEIYTITLRNKSEYYVVLYDGTVNGQEIQLDINGDLRSVKDSEKIYLSPNETKTFKLKFDKFYDESDVDDAIQFNSVRVLKRYYGYTPEDIEQLTKDAIKLYSLTYRLYNED